VKAREAELDFIRYYHTHKTNLYHNHKTSPDGCDDRRKHSIAPGRSGMDTGRKSSLNTEAGIVQLTFEAETCTTVALSMDSTRYLDRQMSIDKTSAAPSA